MIKKQLFPLIIFVPLAYVLGGFIAAVAAFLFIREWFSFSNPEAIKENEISYELALLKLASMLIKSDGAIEESEIAYVQKFFNKTFGPAKSKKLFKQLKELNVESSIPLLVSLIKSKITSGEYFSTLQFLFALASSDGKITRDENQFIDTVGIELGFKKEQINQIRNQFTKQKSQSKKYSPEIIEHLGVLGLKGGVDFSKIKSAYRSLAKEFHPDKLAGMSEGIQNLGKEKFQQISHSYNFLEKHYV